MGNSASRLELGGWTTTGRAAAAGSLPRAAAAAGDCSPMATVRTFRASIRFMIVYARPAATRTPTSHGQRGTLRRTTLIFIAASRPAGNLGGMGPKVYPQNRRFRCAESVPIEQIAFLSVPRDSLLRVLF